jgi:hypothetical protein
MTVTDTLVPIANSTRFNPHETSTATPAVDDFVSNFWGEDGFTFDDVLDLINPLQHLPIISTLYRELTGDDISNAARIIGGTLFGGVAGMASGVVNAMFDEMTGGDIGEQVMALFSGDTPGTDGGEPSPMAAAARPAYGNENRATYRTLLAAQQSPSEADERRIAGTGQHRIADAAPASPDAATPNATVSLATTFYPSDKHATVRLAMAAAPVNAAAEAIAAAAAAAPAVNTAGVAADTVNREAPEAPLWLTSIPAAKVDFTALTGEPMAPAAADLLLNALGPAPDGDARPREAVERYEQGATPANARNTIVDNLL